VVSETRLFASRSPMERRSAPVALCLLARERNTSGVTGPTSLAGVSMTAPIPVPQEHHVLTLTLNRTKHRNALTGEMYDTLAEHIEAASTDEAVLIRGEGNTFCGGNDLRDFQCPEFLSGQSPVLQFLRAVSTLPKPGIAAVRGHAIGTTLLLHGDHTVADTSASFRLPFVQWGSCRRQPPRSSRPPVLDTLARCGSWSSEMPSVPSKPEGEVSSTRSRRRRHSRTPRSTWPGATLPYHQELSAPQKPCS
jgi:hypothetical protein